MFLNQFTQSSPGVKPIEQLTAAFLTLDLQSARSMEQNHAGCVFIDMLASWAGTSHVTFLQILFPDVTGRHSVQQGLLLELGYSKVDHIESIGE